MNRSSVCCGIACLLIASQIAYGATVVLTEAHLSSEV